MGIIDWFKSKNQSNTYYYGMVWGGSDDARCSLL